MSKSSPFLQLRVIIAQFWLQVTQKGSRNGVLTSVELIPDDSVAGLVYRTLGFPPQFFTVLFAIPRVTGYLAHWRESLTDPDTKILRPQQDYRVSLQCW